MAKIRCIIKRPDEEFGHMTNISTTLENLQKTVEGYIECVTLHQFENGKRLVLICNEEGKLRGLDRNFIFAVEGGPIDMIQGTAIIIGAEGEEFCDVPITLKIWKEMLSAWND